MVTRLFGVAPIVVLWRIFERRVADLGGAFARNAASTPAKPERCSVDGQTELLPRDLAPGDASTRRQCCSPIVSHSSLGLLLRACAVHPCLGEPATMQRKFEHTQLRLTPLLAFAHMRQSPVRGEGTTVEIRRSENATSLSGYLVSPPRSAAEGLPGLIVLHELFGLNDQIRSFAVRFAGEGFVTLAVDLYSARNRVAFCLARLAEILFRRPISSGLVRDVEDAIGYLRRQRGVEHDKIGVVGFCLGGTLALVVSTRGSSPPQAVGVFYGTNPDPLATVTRACPIVGTFPARDFTTFGVPALRDRLTEINATCDIRVYPGTYHSFMNDRGGLTGLTYNRVAADEAWARTVGFLRSHLG